jgi:hypothetical protein
MNEQQLKRKAELQALIDNAQSDLEAAQQAAFYPGSTAARDNETLKKGLKQQIADFQRQLSEIVAAERKAEEAKREAAAIEQRRQAEAAERAERKRRKQEEAERLDGIKAERERERQQRAKAEREAAEERAREAERVAQLRREHADKEAAQKAAERERERLQALGAVLTGPNGEEATKFRLKVPGGHVEVRFIPSVSTGE